MKDVVTTSAVFFNYALLAVFAQNAVFTRALGVSRLVQLVGDDRTSSCCSVCSCASPRFW